MVRVITFDEAARVARRQFMASGHLDMAQLCEELSVARATLYRVVGSRDRLLGHVIVDLGAITQQRAMAQVAQVQPPGVERIVQAARVLNEQVVVFAPLRRLIAEDPETAFRVLFTDAGGVHAASVRQWTEAIISAREEGGIVLTREPARLAYMFVRIGESMIYADLLSDREPDLELAADLQRALLTLG